MIHYEYDGLNRKISRTDADGRVTNYEYDAEGNLITWTNKYKGEAFSIPAPSAPEATDEETSVSYYPEGQSNHFGQRRSANAGGVSSLSLRREVFGAFKSKAYSKSAGGPLKQNPKATSGTAVKNSIQKIKQAAARVLNKASSVKSKGGALANRCGVELSKNKIEKRIGDPSKSPARSLHINRGHFPTRPLPSVKPITKAKVSCSAQLALTGGIPIGSAGLSFWEIIEYLFPTMAETGVAIAMIDSPAPGPADLAGLGVAFGGTFIIASGIYAYVNWIYPFVTSIPQGPIIILDPTPDIASPQIEVIPKHNPEKGENVIPLPIPEVEVGGNITGIPVQEEEGVRIITADSAIPRVSLDQLPGNVQESFNRYDKAGWKGNVLGQTQGTRAGSKYGNDTGELPSKDADGNPITYREFDVNNKVAGEDRDGERFVVGSDGSVYYTDSHYGQGTSVNGIDNFVRLR